MSEMTKKQKATLKKLEKARNKLLTGASKSIDSTKPLSINMLAKEAGLGSGTLYYKAYEEFVAETKLKFEYYNNNLSGLASENSNELDSNDKKNNKEFNLQYQISLKNEYREELKEAKATIKTLRARRIEVEHSLYVLHSENLALADLFKEAVGLTPDEYVKRQNSRNVTSISKNRK
jgi:methylphosphotriester-DNA--protein-cysteine methyltransferase